MRYHQTQIRMAKINVTPFATTKMDGPRDFHNKLRKEDRKRKNQKISLAGGLHNRDGFKDLENKHDYQKEK